MQSQIISTSQERFPKWTVVDRIASLGDALKVDEKDLLELIIRYVPKNHK